MKTCTQCRTEKHESEFYFDKTAERYIAKCKRCFIDSRKEYQKLYKKTHPEIVSAQKRRYRQKNISLTRHQESPEAAVRRKAAKVLYDKQRRQEDPVYRLKCNIRRIIRYHLKKRGYTKRLKTSLILGCDFDTFKLHIERQFVRGMAWEMVGKDIHIDHIVPLATAITEDDVIKLNHYTNLRPMWSHENAAKGAKISYLI